MNSFRFNQNRIYCTQFICFNTNANPLADDDDKCDNNNNNSQPLSIEQTVRAKMEHENGWSVTNTYMWTNWRWKWWCYNEGTNEKRNKKLRITIKCERSCTYVCSTCAVSEHGNVGNVTMWQTRTWAAWISKQNSHLHDQAHESLAQQCLAMCYLCIF